MELAEQFVGQELRESHNENLFYWSRDKRGSSAETDYLIEKEGEIIPVEVKSGKATKKPSSFIEYISKYQNSICIYRR